MTVVVVWQQTEHSGRDLSWARTVTDPEGAIHFGVIRLMAGGGVLMASHTEEICTLDSGSVPRRPLPRPQWRFWGIGSGVWIPGHVPPLPYIHERPHVSDSFIGWAKPPPAMVRELILPFWLVAVVTIPLPLAWLRPRVIAIVQRVRRHRATSAWAAGRCGSCGYNLTGNTSGVCPECGTPVPQESEAKA
jgi:hypothetical protein